MADTATATAAPETGATQSNATQGSEANRSLTSPPAPGGQPNNTQPEQQQQLSPLEAAVAAENALAEQQRAMVNGEIPPTTVEGEGNPQPEGEAPTQEATAEPESLDPDDPQAMIRDDKGRFVMRPARAKKLMEKAHAYDELISQLEQQHKQALVQTANQQQKPQGDAQAKPAEPPGEIDAQIQAVREKMKEARANFDTDAEIQAQEQLIDLMAQRKTDQALQEFNNRNKQESEVSQWHAKLDAVETQHQESMQKMWQEDQARVEQIRLQTKNDDLDLQDRESPFMQEVLGQLNQWATAKDPIMLRPNKLRLAVEMVANRRGIELPPVKQVVQPAQSAPTAKPNVTVHRKNAAAIAAGSPSGAAPQTSANIIQNLNQLPPSKRLSVLAQIMDEQAKKGIAAQPIRFM